MICALSACASVARSKIFCFMIANSSQLLSIARCLLGGSVMNGKISPASPRSWVDSFGTAVSIACAIQCTLFPLVISVLPLLGLGFLAGDGIEKGFLGTSVVLAVGSFTWGVRYHQQFYIFLFLISGLFLIFFGRVWVQEKFEILFVVSGALVLASGHLLNRRLCRLCADCETREKK
jgi:MerC mercury resistance protein